MGCPNNNNGPELQRRPRIVSSNWPPSKRPGAAGNAMKPPSARKATSVAPAAPCRRRRSAHRTTREVSFAVQSPDRALAHRDEAFSFSAVSMGDWSSLEHWETRSQEKPVTPSTPKDT